MSDIDLGKFYNFFSHVGIKPSGPVTNETWLEAVKLLDENFEKLRQRIPIVNESAASYIKDDFGVRNTTTANVGELGWSFSNLTITYVNESGRPGIINCAVGVATGALFNPVTASVAMHTSEFFDVIWKVKIPASLVLTALRFGLFNGAATLNPPADGIYYEWLAADTNWFGVNRAAAAQTRIDTGVPVVIDEWFTLRLRRKSANAISFSTNLGRDLDNLTNIPSVAANPVAQIINAAGTKNMQLDFFSNLITNLVR